jgi:hypothetical protein
MREIAESQRVRRKRRENLNGCENWQRAREKFKDLPLLGIALSLKPLQIETGSTMDLPRPRPAYFAATPISSPPISSPSSPLSTAPPSPTAATHAPFEYPPSSYAPSSAPASRSSSKNPLFKKDLENSRRTRNEGSSSWNWITRFLLNEKGDTGSRQANDLELEETRGRRRRSVSHAEAQLDSDTQSERRNAQAVVQEELERRTTKGSQISKVGSASSQDRKKWFTKERSQLAVAFASESSIDFVSMFGSNR